ncbi:substrate-binding domain-containing protein [Vibrio sp.]|nr:substrate-binding domain-containing protein [Vibrio sp.]
MRLSLYSLNYQIMIAHYGYSLENEEKSIISLLSYNVDALILSSKIHTEKTNKILKSVNIPVVEIMDIESDLGFPTIGFDNFEASKEMTIAMLNSGREHIAYFAARMDYRTQKKIDGYCAAMQSMNKDRIILKTDSPSSFTLGGQLLRDVIDKYPNVDGIFCTNDDLAIGALYECQRQQISVPDTMAIAGFHGHDISQAMVPKMATVITPREAIGKIASERVIGFLQGSIATIEHSELNYVISLSDTV